MRIATVKSVEQISDVAWREETAEELLRRADEMEARLSMKKDRRLIVSPVPERSIEQEVQEHNTTNSLPQSWCPHYAKRVGTNEPLRRQREEVSDDEADLTATLTISMDLMYFYEKGERPARVAVDHESGRVWSYALRGQTILGGMGWIQKRIAQGIDNAGHKDVKILVESDQGMSMVALQYEIQSIRDAKIIPSNSPVGESESNGRPENTMRRVQDKARTIKRHAGSETGTEIYKMVDMMSWLVR